MAAKDLLENVIEQKKSIEDIYSELERVLQSNRKLQNDLVTLGKFFKDEIAQIKKYIVDYLEGGIESFKHKVKIYKSII